jgi:hypothetical protein
LHWEVDMLITILPVIGSLLPLGSPHPLGGLPLDPKLNWIPTWPISKHTISRSYSHSPLAKKEKLNLISIACGAYVMIMEHSSCCTDKIPLHNNNMYPCSYLLDQHIIWSLWSPCSTGQKENWKKNIENFCLIHLKIPPKKPDLSLSGVCIGVHHAHNGTLHH